MNSKTLTQSVSILPHAYKEHDHSTAKGNIIPSLFHVAIAPLALSLGSHQAGLLYFALAMVAYFTIYSDKNYYVKAILKTVAAFVVAGIVWFGLIGFIGVLASLVGVSA